MMRIMRSTLFCCLFLLLIQVRAVAQEHAFTCQQDNPTTKSLKNLKQLVNRSEKSTDLKIIPVVFHVLHQNGPENISDLQILDAVRILNENFQKMNADTSQVVSPFDTIIGKVNFEFRLATIDPAGNPTNGIDRILTPLTNSANDQSKLNSWDPQKYVNIWVVKTIGFSGVSGYAYNPLSAVPDECTDGIVMLHNYTGSIGTGAQFTRFFLTHEMGHYFGLFHPHEDMFANPHIWCDYTDGISDTPRQIGNSSCNLTANTCNDLLYAESFNYWGSDVPDMTQNFMNSSHCMVLFTQQQAALMRSVVESPLYGRNQLWIDANLVATGTGPGAAPVSAALPNAAFSIQSTSIANIPYLNGMICEGDDIQFVNQNGSPAGTTYSWSFPGGVPATSTLANPTVNYANPGYYDVTLTVTNAHGSVTSSRSAIVYASGSWPEFIGPTVQDFDLSGNFWQSQNTDDDSFYFQRIPDHGTQNTGCFLLENHYDPDTTMRCYQTSDQQINRKKDFLVSPAFDLSNSTNITVSFDYAYGSAADPDSSYDEVIKVYSSRDCGKTWTPRQTILGSVLITAFAAQESYFVPASNQWKQASFTYTTGAMDKRVRFKMEFSATNQSNNLYIDNFVIDGILGISDHELSGISVYPNPSKVGNSVTISGLYAAESTISIYDLQGKIVVEKAMNATGENVELDMHLKAGCYLVEVAQNDSRFLTRLVVE